MEFDFEKNPVVETIEVVPEKYRGLYSEISEGDNAGQFGLSDAAKGLVADYTGLAKTAAGLRQEKKAASDESAKRRHELKTFGETLTNLGVEVGEEGAVAALEAAWTDLQEKVKGGSALKVDLEKIKTQFATQLAEAKAEHEKAQGSMMDTLTNHMVVGTATAAIAEANGSVPLLLPLVKSQAKVVPDEEGAYVVRVLDGDGNIRLDAAGNPMNIKGLIAEMKGQDDYAGAFKSETKGGTGSPPGGLGKPANRQSNSGKSRDDMTPAEKIRAGLNKGQYSSGRPRATG